MILLENALLQLLAILFGAAIVFSTVRSALQTFVLPRSVQDKLTRQIFQQSRRLFDLYARLRRVNDYETRDRLMAFYAPLTLLLTPVVMLIYILIGYMFIYWGMGIDLGEAFRLSGSSMLTLGFVNKIEYAFEAVIFSEAVIGLILVALLIAYLPTIYAAFAKREAAVTMLEVRAGSPPSAAEMILRHHRLQRLDKLSDVWVQWETWFVELEESHTSLVALVFYRSPVGHRSWVTAAGAVLDAAALTTSTLDIPQDMQANITLRAGYLSLRHIANFFNVDYPPDPRSDDPISIQRTEFDEVYDQFAAQGVPVKSDRDQAWRDFAGWRVNYDAVLLALAALTQAPYAPWSSDRSVIRVRERAHAQRKLR